MALRRFAPIPLAQSTPFQQPTALDGVVAWNVERNLNTFDLTAETAMLLEELQEFLLAKTVDDRVDAAADIIVLAAGIIHKLGYSPEASLTETVKEISSRKGSIDPTTGKWQKDRNQDPATLYKANYNLTKTKESL